MTWNQFRAPPCQELSDGTKHIHGRPMGSEISTWQTKQNKLPLLRYTWWLPHTSTSKCWDVSSAIWMTEQQALIRIFMCVRGFLAATIHCCPCLDLMVVNILTKHDEIIGCQFEPQGVEKSLKMTHPRTDSSPQKNLVVVLNKFSQNEV